MDREEEIKSANLAVSTEANWHVNVTENRY
jgi:hypothetical protein